jgi:hypothetical protein
MLKKILLAPHQMIINDNSPVCLKKAKVIGGGGGGGVSLTVMTSSIG